MKIPIIDLKRQYKSIEDAVKQKIDNILKAQAFILGEELKTLEENIAKLCGVQYGIGVNSGTDALILGLDALGVKAGDEVITTPFTFIATAEAIVRVGAKPVFVDVIPESFNINPDLIKKKITKKTKAILPVHLYGLCADMDPILKIAKENNIAVIEDCAQAISSEYHNKKAGSLGNVSALSFYPGKNLGAFGDAGMVLTRSGDLYEKLMLLRNHGSNKKYYHEIVGCNTRLDNLQAAVLNIKLSHLEKWTEIRIKNADFYNKALLGYPVITPQVPEGYRHTYHLYVLRSEKKDDLVQHLNRVGVEARTYYPLPLHLQKSFSYLDHGVGDFPQAEKLSKTSFAIPVCPELTEEEKRYIVEKIKEFFE